MVIPRVLGILICSSLFVLATSSAWAEPERCVSKTEFVGRLGSRYIYGYRCSSEGVSYGFVTRSIQTMEGNTASAHVSGLVYPGESVALHEVVNELSEEAFKAMSRGNRTVYTLLLKAAYSTEPKQKKALEKQASDALRDTLIDYWRF